jgi:hypothetical protein
VRAVSVGWTIDHSRAADALDTKPDRSKIDARADTVDALARITGWDPRKGGKSVEDAAAAFLAECR